MAKVVRCKYGLCYAMAVFDHLQFAKMEVEGLGDLVIWDDIR